MSTLNIRMLDASAPEFQSGLDTLLDRSQGEDTDVAAVVRDILLAVRKRGDPALLEYTRRFDKLRAATVADLEITPDRLSQAIDAVDTEQYQALEAAADRLRSYHEKQKSESWEYTDADGTLLGQQVTALDRVGMYVPGGKAAYPSSVLMNAIPAKVAGVSELIMAVPAPDGMLNDMVLAAASIAGVDCIFTVGGAQAVAALAYGTDTVPRVDKIVGPGNIYVATAKRMVFGQVDIDMIAGPSEIVVVCDGRTEPDWVAMDLFAQAEHDELAQAILISLDEQFSRQVKLSMEKLLDDMPRKEIIKTSLEQRGAIINVVGLSQAIELVNRIAPEHLELSLDDARNIAAQVRHAGAIFLGRYTAEVVGDYCAGPNHVLPTSGTARFSSPLGVYDFQKRTSLIGCTGQSAEKLGNIATVLAESEGFTAHARSAAYRIS
ncbi:MAG: histidinol dehydrogenase [Gammaproteobacteria bacterium]|nr:MAG: histidinol dehydrogenase [Gammaproteobacteria bacterium]